ncbi:tyrosine-protein phosphatase siw14 [Sporothrix eucalyptigena]|uniref:diphosphoinositol-polyphosphate diphosphatase n=1 Tax=Sporothrix eucalyptigena TaxID=1812306 RepID=A0ABP0CVE2_9PEZI
MASELLQQGSDIDMTDDSDMPTLTRRSTRSFVESELDADLRELQQSVESESGFDSRFSDMLTSAGQHGLHLRTNIDQSTGGSSGVISSRASTVSSAYSLSTPSSVGGDATSATLMDEDAFRDLDLNVPPVPPGAPVNFGFVMPGLYRSSYPKPENFEYLQQLGLKTIVTLVDKNYTEEYGEFINSNNIRHHMFAMKGTKKEEIPLSTMESILRLVLDRRNYPLLIHCNQGRHRTGCVVAIVRKIAGWDRTTVTDEYRAYAGHKVRDCDVDYIQAFALSSIEKLRACDDLNIDELIVSSRIGGPMVGRPPPTTVGFRVPNFFRTTFFSMTVLFIWMVSGSKMPPPNRQ